MHGGHKCPPYNRRAQHRNTTPQALNHNVKPKNRSNERFFILLSITAQTNAKNKRK
jgi:hypothetical protein